MHVDILGLATRSSFCPAKEICKGVSVVWGVTLGTKEEEGRKEKKRMIELAKPFVVCTTPLHHPTTTPTLFCFCFLICPPEPRFDLPREYSLRKARLSNSGTEEMFHHTHTHTHTRLTCTRIWLHMCFTYRELLTFSCIVSAQYALFKPQKLLFLHSFVQD